MANTGKGKDETRKTQDPREGRAKSTKPSAGKQDDFQNPRSSGTTGLGGESKTGGSVREPGGIEGAGGEQ